MTFRQLERGLSAIGSHHDKVGAFQSSLHKTAYTAVIIYDQHRRRFHVRALRQQEGEDAALARFALRPDAPAVHLHQLAAKVEAETEALVGCGVSILDLVEAIEDPPQFLLGNAPAGVGDRHTEEAGQVWRLAD